MDLVSYDAMVTEIGESADKDATRLMQVISNVSAEAIQYLDRVVEIETGKVEIFDIPGKTMYFPLSAWPVTALTDVRNDTERVFGADTIVDATSYSYNPDTGMIAFDNPWTLTFGHRALQVTYDGGMAATTAAFEAAYPDISSALITEIEYRYTRKKQAGLIASASQGGSVTMVRKGNFLAEVAEVLDTHRRITNG